MSTSLQRTPDQIYADILGELNMRGPLKISHIMLHVNLNSSAARNYLTTLITRGHIEAQIKNRTKQYAIIEKGREWLDAYKKLQAV